MTTTAAPAPPTPAPTTSASLFRGPHLPLALGAVALVTLGALEARAVSTALPSMVRELDAVGAFGVAAAAPAASYLVALAVTGLWADRRGPVPPLRLGIATFALAQLVVGLAVSMPMVVAGRLLGGLAEGLLDVALMVLVARTLPAELRPRMFSLFAAAWILPSVLGPVVTGVVTEQAGWRWVFLGALALLVPAWLLLRPAVRLAAAEPARDPSPDAAARPERALVPWAVTAAVAVLVLTVAGEQLDSRTGPALLAIAGGAALLAASATRVLPAGTLRAERGIPAVTLVRSLTGAAFSGVGAFLPLLLTVLHGFPPSLAGVSLTITGVTWAAGSWAQGRDHTVPRVLVLRAGLALMSTGLAVTTLLAWPGLTPWVGLAGWCVAGLGMGLASPSLSVLALDLSADHEQGRNSSALQMAGSTSMALTLAAGGTLLALSAPSPGPLAFGSTLLGGFLAAVTGLLVAGRVTPRAAVTSGG